MPMAYLCLKIYPRKRRPKIPTETHSQRWKYEEHQIWVKRYTEMPTFRDEMWVKSKLAFIHIILEGLNWDSWL